MKAILQTILLPLSKYKNLKEAKKYIKSHGYKLKWRNKLPEQKGNFWHFRQNDKNKSKKYFTHKKKSGEEYVFFLI